MAPFPAAGCVCVCRWGVGFSLQLILCRHTRQNPNDISSDCAVGTCLTGSFILAPLKHSSRRDSAKCDGDAHTTNQLTENEELSRPQSSQDVAGLKWGPSYRSLHYSAPPGSCKGLLLLLWQKVTEYAARLLKHCS